MFDQPLYGLKGFSTTIATDINDLPTTSPHGSDFKETSTNLELATDPNETRGTARAHRDPCFRQKVDPSLPVAVDWAFAAWPQSGLT
jgi:hypothetical protein